MSKDNRTEVRATVGGGSGKVNLQTGWIVFLSLAVAALFPGCGGEKEVPISKKDSLFWQESPDTSSVAESLSVKTPIVKEEPRNPEKTVEKGGPQEPKVTATPKTTPKVSQKPSKQPVDKKSVEVVKKADPPKEVAVKTPVKKTPDSEKTDRKDIYKPEDMPTPKKMKISPEANTALKEEKTEEAVKPPGPTTATSPDYTRGMDAYKNKNYAMAIEHFSKVPVPDTKKRGDEPRDEYVQANFFKGLAQQKQGKLQQAVASYAKVLQYEPYHPIVRMNQGICYLELRKFGKADDAFEMVIRDQNRIPPEQYDEIMQRTRYFWALTWTRMYKFAKEPDKKDYFMRSAGEKWSEYMAWYGKDSRFAGANDQADQYLKTLQNP